MQNLEPLLLSVSIFIFDKTGAKMLSPKTHNFYMQYLEPSKLGVVIFFFAESGASMLSTTRLQPAHIHRVLYAATQALRLRSLVGRRKP